MRIIITIALSSKPKWDGSRGSRGTIQVWIPQHSVLVSGFPRTVAACDSERLAVTRSRVFAESGIAHEGNDSGVVGMTEAGMLPRVGYDGYVGWRDE